MPELPEVETVKRGLAPVMEGARITSVTLNRPDLRFPFPEHFRERLTGWRVEKLERRAKYLLVHLTSGETLIAHLGMSGRFVVEGDRDSAENPFHHDQGRLPAHDHVIFGLDTALGQRAEVLFNDPRRFGFMDLAATDDLATSTHFAAMGPEPLGNEFSWPVLAQRFAGKKAPVKQALLDQRIVAGLGNIYVCEALWEAKISPKRQAGKVGARKGEVLVAAIRSILQSAIRAGGSTLRDHAGVDGTLGYFQHDFRVYGREGEQCPRCTRTISRITQSGRSSFYCSNCQR